MLRINKNTPIINPRKEDNHSNRNFDWSWSSELTFESPNNDDKNDDDNMILSETDKYYIGWEGI